MWTKLRMETEMSEAKEFTDVLNSDQSTKNTVASN